MIDIEILTAVLKEHGYLSNSYELEDKQQNNESDLASNLNDEMDEDGSI